MENKQTEAQWVVLLTKLDGLNRRVKEPGWLYEDKQSAYRLKDEVLAFILRTRPAQVSVAFALVPYVLYSRASKDRAGDLMRQDSEKHPFEYYLGQIAPGPGDYEDPAKATVEVTLGCSGLEFSFHQPLSWFIAQGGDPSGLEKKAWINADNFHHAYLEKTQDEVNALLQELRASFGE